MTLAQLRYLLAIVDAGLNITLGAERINATQPGLSKQLKQLEDQLSLRLFVRHGRNLERLTDAGREIVQRARLIVTEADNIATFAANQRRVGHGTLRIEATHIQAQFVLPDALALLRRQFPEVDVSLGFGADEDERTSQADHADFRMFSTDGRIPGGGLAIPLYQWDPVAIMPLDHPLTRSDVPLSLERLAAFPLITYDTSRTAPLSIAQTFLNAGLSPRFAYTVRDAGVTKSAARSGLGVGLLAEMAVDAPERDLAVLQLAGLFPRCTAWAVLRPDRIMRDYTIQLLACLSGTTPRAIGRAADGELLTRNAGEQLMWSALAATMRAKLSPRIAA